MYGKHLYLTMKLNITVTQTHGGTAYITRKAPGALDPAVVLPPGGVLRSLKIKALGCVAKDTTSISLAERKLEDWGK